ncbi:MAG: glutathione peroxidase [Crocinitomicaceae bacterium]|jgi:glutathione peroxidase
MNIKLIISTMTLFGLFSFMFNPKIKELKTPVQPIYEIEINALNGDALDLSDYSGKKLLIVNVASKCGFTPQYKGLQELQEAYGDQLTIIGVPCNQFMGQEPGTSEEIASFCQVNYGVTFQITEKVDVKGKDQHPLYQWLTKKENNGSENSSVKWNFQKYLISENGELEAIFSTKTVPMSEEITKHFQ